MGTPAFRAIEKGPFLKSMRAPDSTEAHQQAVPNLVGRTSAAKEKRP